MANPEPIHRAPMRARAIDAPRDAGAAFGLARGLVGIGESLEVRPDNLAEGDRGNVRATEWLSRPFGGDEIPPAVGATFARGGHNLRRTHNAAAERRTASLWEKWGGR